MSWPSRDVANDILAADREKVNAFEEICFQVAKTYDSNSGRFNFITRFLDEAGRALARYLRLDDHAVAAEVARCALVLNFSKAAGTAEQRRAAQDARDAAAKALADRGPSIRDKISRLEAELAELERVARDAAADVDRRAEAVERFRERCIPIDIENAVIGRRNRVRNCFHKQIGPLEQRRGDLSSVRDLTVESDLFRISRHLETFAPDVADLFKSQNPQMQAGTWGRYVSSLAAKIAEIDAELEPLKEARAAALQACSEPIEAYVSKHLG